MVEHMPSGIYRRFVWGAVILLAIVLIGTVGYWFIGGRQYSFVDTLYMTVITITTIGFEEVIDLSGNVGGRIFTIFIAISGIGIMAYIVTNITALVVEGELTESFRRRRMEKIAGNYKGHYIVCGLGRVGCYIANELHATRRPHVIVDVNKKATESSLESFHDEVFIAGDATDSDTLLKAGIEKAAGLFAVTGDDNQNLVVSLTAKQLNQVEGSGPLQRHKKQPKDEEGGCRCRRLTLRHRRVEDGFRNGETHGSIVSGHHAAGHRDKPAV
jgi:voltage-gated potassium channel